MSTEAQPAAGSEDTGRGRPRPQDVIDRDNRVHQALVDKGPMDREGIAEAVGTTPSLAYMSLFRLRRDGRVRRASGEGDTRSHTWEAVPPTA